MIKKYGLESILKNKFLVVGVDPDTKKCGVCFMSGKGEILALKNIPPLDVMRLFTLAEDAIFAIEDVAKIKTIYNRNRRRSKAVQAKIAQNVGMVKGVAELLFSAADEAGVAVVRVHPGIGRQVKENAKLFNEIFNWSGRSNADTRDAAAIARYALNKINATHS